MDKMEEYFWMKPWPSSTHDHNGLLDKSLYFSAEYLSASRYFRGEEGEPGSWELHFIKEPCDLASAPFNPVVSQKFKDIADSLSIEAAYHAVRIFINKNPTDLKYYLVKPPILNFMDIRSDGVKLIPDDVITDNPGWIQGWNNKTKVHRNKLDGVHWARQEKAFGVPWIVCKQFRQEIEQQKMIKPLFKNLIVSDS